jgi:hypothetical protein
MVHIAYNEKLHSRRVKKFSNAKFLALAFAILCFAFLPAISHQAKAQTQTSTGVIVPLYMYPNYVWTDLIQAHEAYPSVPIVAAVNPDDGPGYGVDPFFLSQVQALQSAGIIVIGYDNTQYGSVPLSTVEAQASDYVSWYGLSGIYVDCMSNIEGWEWYYSDVTSYAHSIGAWEVIGNPGADVPSDYVGTVDSIIIYENAGLPSLSFLAGWHASYSASNFGIVSYADGFNPSYISSATAYLHWIYTTDGVWPNPYTQLPSYFYSLLSTIAGASAASSPSPSPAPPPASSAGPGTISVITVSESSGEIYGMYTTLWENGALVASCFSPCTFSVSGSTSYSVAVSNYGGYYYQEWADGTLSTFFPVSEPGTPTQLTLTAFYN